ncbi:hypothetical protein DL768_003843 [Monosporascus sp. mg162]|nr:hypothetical protein DL768_003843 [Monosporascus sp. mg162]
MELHLSVSEAGQDTVDLRLDVLQVTVFYLASSLHSHNLRPVMNLEVISVESDDMKLQLASLALIPGFDYAREKQNNNLPVVFERGTETEHGYDGDEGYAFVLDELLGEDGQFLPGSNNPIKVEVYGYRDVSIDGQQPGFQRLREGTVPSDKLVLGVLRDAPITIQGLSKKITTKAVSSARDSNFAQILDMTYQILTQITEADELPSGCRLESSLLRLVSDPKQRQEAIDELYRASETAGTWALLKDGPPHPSRIWSELEHFTADDPKVTDEDKGKQVVYALLYTGVVPAGSTLVGDSLLLPDGSELEEASILGLVNYPDGPINSSSRVYATYYGVTDDLEERLNRGHRQGIEGVRDQTNGHYRIARFILKLQNSDWRMYKLMIIDSNSRMGHHSNFRYFAEQATITYNDSYNQRLIESGTRLNVGEGSNPQSLTAVVVHFPVADVLRQCHGQALEQLGLTRRTDVIGCNWQSPINSKNTLEHIRYSRFLTYDGEGKPYMHILTRPTPVTAYHLHTTPEVALHVTPRPGKYNFTIPREWPVSVNQKIYVQWEIALNGPHRFPLCPVPCVGPMDDWDTANSLALLIKWEDSEGRWFKGYLLQAFTHYTKAGRKAGQNASPEAQVLSNLNLHPYRRAREIMAALNHDWNFRGRPDFLDLPSCRVHDIRFDAFRRALTCSPIFCRDKRHPRLLSAENIRAGIEAKRGETTSFGQQIQHSQNPAYNRRKCDLCYFRGRAWTCKQQTVRLPTGEEVLQCDRCSALGWPFCTFTISPELLWQNPIGRLLGIFEDKIAWQIEKPDLRDMLKPDDGDEEQDGQDGEV